MAVVGPVLVADTTNTSGTGSLSLNNASSDGRRGLADAVTNGDAANTEEVHYLILATNTSGGTLRFEKGIGTISDNGATLSRDTVHQSSNSGNKVSLPGGSTHDVLIAVGLEDLVVAANEGSEYTPTTFATNLGLPLLTASNTFGDAIQIIRNSGAGSQRCLEVRNTATAGVSNRTRIEWRLATTDFSAGAAVNMEGGFSNIGSGTEETTLECKTFAAGSSGTAFKVVGQSLQDASGNKYDALESGTQFTCHSTIPTGWSRVNVTGERVVKLAESGDTVGGTGGSWTVSGLSGSTTVNNHTLTVSEMPSHTHGTTATQSTGGATVGPANRITDHSTGIVTSVSSGSTGGGAGHNHTASTTVSSNGSWRPAYRIACIIEKDA